MQRSDLEAEISRLLGDPSNQRWSTTVIDARLDAAEVDVNVWTNAPKVNETLTPTASSPYVSVSTKVVDILRATYTLSDGTVKTDKSGFKPSSIWDLDFNRPRWQNETPGEPTQWSFDASNARIILVPAPDAANATTGCLIVQEVQTPTTPVSQGTSTSVPFDSNALMVPYHRALIYWVVSECLKDNNDQDSLNKARFFRSNDLQKPGEYEVQIKKILMKFDAPEAIQTSVKWQPTGGRLSGNAVWPGKANPLYWM